MNLTLEKRKRRQAPINLLKIFIGRIEEWFKSKTEPFHLIWSSRDAFLNHQYFELEILHFVVNFDQHFPHAVWLRIGSG